MFKPSLRSRSVALTAALCVVAPFAVAQEQTEPGEKPERLDRIEEMTVTATKREASIQDVPIAISAFSADDLDKRGIGDLEALQQIAPSLSVYSSNSTTNGGTLRIRGVGTTGNNIGLESAVGTFVDGVYRSRSGQVYSELLDVERIEIMRGPQGTLFGKNTSAGAIHFITKKPEFEFGYGGEVTVGTEHTFRTKGAVTGPIVDELLAYRFAFSHSERDGWYQDSITSDKYGEIDRRSIKAQMLLTPTPNVDFRLVYDWRTDKGTCCPATYSFQGPAAPAAQAAGAQIFGETTGGDKTTRVGVNHKPWENVIDWGLTGEMNWELDSGTVTSITAWRDFKVSRGQDIDFSGADILRPNDIKEGFENFSQEIRMTGSTDTIDWLVGAYGYTERLKETDVLELGTGADLYAQLAFAALGIVPGDFAAGDINMHEFDQSTVGWSLFTHNTAHLTDRLDVTFGFRWSFEHKEGKGIINGAAPGTIVNTWGFCGGVAVTNPLRRSLCDNASFDAKRTEREPTGTIKLAYDVTDDVNTYASYSRGYKAGGFNLDRNANTRIDGGGAVVLAETNGATEFEPEFVDAYEIGMKGNFLDDTLQVNTAVFYQQFEGFQLNTFTGLGFFVSNLKEVVSRGVETEVTWVVMPGVTLTTGATWNIARYSNNENDGEIVAGADLIRGKRLTQSPRWQGNSALYVEQPLGGSDWMGLFNANLSYRGAQNSGSDLDPRKDVSGVWLANASVGVRSPDEKWEAVLWVKNLTNKRYETLIFDSVLQGGSYSTFMNEDRSGGVTLKYKFY